MIAIRCYNNDDESALFNLIKREGDEWQDYWKGASRTKYKVAIKSSIIYLAHDGETLCGYCRCRDDDGYGVYVYDLLVDKAHRGKCIGKLLMEKVCADYLESTVYVMSDVDGYYEKLGYQRKGSIFEVCPQIDSGLSAEETAKRMDVDVSYLEASLEQ